MSDPIMVRRLTLEKRLQSRIARIFQTQRQQFDIEALVTSAGITEAQPIRDDLMTLLLMVWPDMSEQLAITIARDSLVAAQFIGNITLASIGYSHSFTIAAPVRDRIATGSVVAADRIDETSRERIREILTRGIANDWDLRRITQTLRQEMTGWSKSRAETIARTEIAEAWGSTQHEVLARNGWTRRLWLSAQDERVDWGDEDGPCVRNHEAGAVPISQPFPSGDYWAPSHPNCRCTIAPAPGFGPAEPREPWVGDTMTDYVMPARTMSGA